MFTGIVEGTGEVVSARDTAGGRRLRVRAGPPGYGELHPGQSISVSGACLTVEDHGTDDGGAWFEVFLAEETVERTYLGGLTAGDRVNLERAMAADDRFDGHLVQGHVDATARVVDVERVGGAEEGDGSGDSAGATDDGDWRFGFDLPAAFERYVVPKGSVALDGISLTVAGVSEGEFSVAVIPATYAVTTLSEKAVGDPVHLEVDVVAKYVESMVEGYR